MRMSLDLFDFLIVFVLAVTLIAVVGIGSEGLSLAVVIVCAVISVGILAIGRTVLSLVPEAMIGFRQPAEIVVGVAGLSIFTWLGCNVFGISAGKAFVMSCGLAATAFWYNTRVNHPRQSWGCIDLVVLIVICCVSVIWCWEAIHAVPTLRTTGRFPVWADYNLQAMQVASFARLTVAPFAIPFYHSASLMLPAAFNAIAQVPALVCATALWTPLGFIVMGLGGYALGTVAAGRPGGIASAAALLLVPNSAHYLRNGMFDFHWLAEISTGASYALGLSLVAVAFGVLVLRHHCARTFWLAGTLTLAVLALRSQIFLPLAVTALLLIAFLWRPSRVLIYIGGLSAIGLVATCGVFVAEALPRAPHLFSDWPPDPMRYVRFALALGPAVQAQTLDSLFASLPMPIAVVVGLIYLLVTAGGIMLVAVFLGFIWCGRRQLLLNERWVPIATIAAFVLAVVLLPPSVSINEPLETHHSQTLFLYAILAAWSGCFLGAWAQRRWVHRATGTVATAAALLLPVPFLFSAAAQVPAGAFQAWTAPYVGLTIPPGMIEAATFLRDHSALPDRVVATSNYQCGPLMALVERAILFPENCEARSVTPASTTATRSAPPGSMQAQVLSATSYEDFVKPARKLGATWIFMYATSPPPSWLIDGSVWHSRTFFIFHTGYTQQNRQ
jgi:hypothetical protein